MVVVARWAMLCRQHRFNHAQVDGTTLPFDPIHEDMLIHLQPPQAATLPAAAGLRRSLL